MTSPSVVAHLDPPVTAFLETFRAGIATLDLDGLRNCFAETFLAGDGNGAVPVPREAFLSALPARASAAEKAGIGSARLVDATAQRLDDRWTLLSTAWSAPLHSGGELPMSSTFLLHDDGSGARAAVYLNHQGLPLRSGAGDTGQR